jgi:hypothetical protein
MTRSTTYIDFNTNTITDITEARERAYKKAADAAYVAVRNLLDSLPPKLQTDAAYSLWAQSIALLCDAGWTVEELTRHQKHWIAETQAGRRLHYACSRTAPEKPA